MNTYKQISESIVLINEDIQCLRHPQILKGSVNLRSMTFPYDEGNLEYVEGKDYIVDYNEGTIRRTSDSRITNWVNHAMYGESKFDHRLFEDYSNKNYTVFIDYEFIENEEAFDIKTINEKAYKFNFVKKLERFEPIKYLVYGDSISGGGEASRDKTKFFNRFADNLQAIYPGSHIDVIMKAVGGEDSSGGLERFDKDVLCENPDLMTIGYGMNDQNKWENGNQVPVELYKSNIREMVNKIKEHTKTEIILITPCLPNPLWMHTSGDSPLYAQAIREIGEETNVYVADLQSLWIDELNTGKSYESLLLNNINHPNDYGHWLYCKALMNLL